MLKHRLIKISLFVAMAILLNFYVINYANIDISYNKLEIEMSSSSQEIIQVFYDENSNWAEEKSQKKLYEHINTKEKLTFEIPASTKKLRIDFGDSSDDIEIFSLDLKYFNKKISILDLLESVTIKNDIQNMVKVKDRILIGKLGNDSYVVIQDIDKITSELMDIYAKKLNLSIKSIFIVIINAVVLILAQKRKVVFSVIKEIYENRLLVWSLAKNDFKTRYAGSYLGIIWAFVNPLVTILIYWFVFEFGLKAGAPIPNVPFILWFSAGLIPWFFFSDSINNATNSFIEYSYLVKKVVFKISILPVVKIISTMFIHLVFLILIIAIYSIYGIYPNIYMLQLIYYSLCVFALSLALTYATSAIILFFKDLGQIIGLLLQVGMWMTPIMWSYTIIPQNLQWIVKLNPMFYVVEGYRNVLINKALFIGDFIGTAYFWGVTILLFIIGMSIFKKLKPHFSDVL